MTSRPAVAGSPVVVAVDGSACGEKALAWAVDEALAEHRAVRVVHSWEVVVSGYVPVPSEIEIVHDAAKAVLAAAVDAVHDLAPGLHVEGRLVHGGAGHAILEESRDAALVVTGSRGRGGFRGLLLGSTSVEVTAHATVPVVVVRGQDAEASWRRAPVVCGVDGSEVSEAALGFAFEAAARRGEGLTVVNAWQLPNPYAEGVYSVLADELPLVEGARLALAESLAGWREKYPDVPVTQVVERGHPVDVLCDQARGAALLVVGSRGRGGFRGLLLGSTSHGIVRHSPCPVAVVRPSAD